MSEVIEQQLQILKKEGGPVTTAQIECAGINRVMIPGLVEKGELIKERRGVYSFPEDFPDEFRTVQVNNPRVIYSYGTALYLWNMSDRLPHIWDVSVPQGFNATRLKKDHETIRVHYVNSSKWKIGITETLTPEGSTVRLYDKERCMIDLIRGERKVSRQIFLQGVREYFKDQDNDRAKLIQYSRIFHVEGKVRTYMDILIG